MHPEVLALLPDAAFGALAALIAGMAKSHRLELPRVVRTNAGDGEVVLIDLGFLGAPLLGMIAAAAMDGGPRMAFLYGACAGIMGPAILNTILEPILAKLGMPPASGGDGDK